MVLDDENDSSETEYEDDFLLENPRTNFLSKYPKPFGGEENEDIYNFLDKFETAFSYNRVRAADKVTVLKRLMKGHAENTVSESESFDDNVKRLKNVFGNPHGIWSKERDDFLQRSRNEIRNWTPYFSPQRKLMLLKVSNFLRNAEHLAKKFETIKYDVFSRSTVESIMVILPPKVNLDIITKETETRESTGGVSNSMKTFKNIQEVVNKEIELEIIASEHYDALAESYRIHSIAAHEDEKIEAIKICDDNYDKDSGLKTIQRRKNYPKSRAILNLDNHLKRISKNARQNKNVEDSMN